LLLSKLLEVVAEAYARHADLPVSNI
jgi:hypothetical protein